MNEARNEARAVIDMWKEDAQAARKELADIAETRAVYGHETSEAHPMSAADPMGPRRWRWREQGAAALGTGFGAWVADSALHREVALWFALVWFVVASALYVYRVLRDSENMKGGPEND